MTRKNQIIREPIGLVYGHSVSATGYQIQSGLTGKVLQSFKNIDTGARGHADAFKALNAELSTAEKSYKNISSAMDKMALTPEQRRQKIVAEYEAQQKQKIAQTALLGAKAQQMEQTNRLIDAKMQAQQAQINRRNHPV